MLFYSQQECCENEGEKRNEMEKNWRARHIYEAHAKRSDNDRCLQSHEYSSLMDIPTKARSKHWFLWQRFFGVLAHRMCRTWKPKSTELRVEPHDSLSLILFPSFIFAILTLPHGATDSSEGNICKCWSRKKICVRDEKREEIIRQKNYIIIFLFSCLKGREKGERSNRWMSLCVCECVYEKATSNLVKVHYQKKK